VAAAGLALAGTVTAGSIALDRDPGPGGGPAAAAAVSSSATTATVPVVTTTTAPPPPELPRGGRRLFPRYRVVGFDGMQDLDVLGAGPPDVAAQRLLKVARPYATSGHPVMPMFELIATVAHPFPSPSGLYRTHQEDDIVRSFLKGSAGSTGCWTCSRAGTTSSARCGTGNRTSASPTSASPSTRSSPWAPGRCRAGSSAAPPPPSAAAWP
jgi:hypothetical protein